MNYTDAENFTQIATYMKHFPGHGSRHALALLVPSSRFQKPDVK
jgi:hypothetical protein